MKELKKEFAHFSKNGSILVCDYGFVKFGGQNSYFSVTGTEYLKERCPGEKAKKFLGEYYWPWSCGMLHSLIEENHLFLTPYLKYHLFDSKKGPMHYIENAIFWAEMASGVVERRQYDPDPIETFKSTICFGGAKTDKDEDLNEFFNFRLKGQVRPVLTSWLEARLPNLMENFWADMEKLGFDKKEIDNL